MNTLVRRLIIVVLGLAAVGLVVYLVMNMTMGNPVEDRQEATSEVETKSAQELIAEKKFALVELNEDGFTEDSYEVPLGGIIELRNNTDRDLMLDLRNDNFVAGMVMEADSINYSPVLTESGEYVLSEFLEGDFSEDIRATVIVK